MPENNEKKNKPIILVMGGSFNPPTVAHTALLAHAMKGIGADEGIMVPSSNDYVYKKIRRHGKWGKTPCIPFDLRIRMLREAIRELPGITIGSITVSDTERFEHMGGNTYRTLCKLRDRNPSKEIVFLLGDDKLNVFARWGSTMQLLDGFRIAVLTRTGESDLADIPSLADRRDRFLFVEPPRRDYSGISSSAFWEAWGKKNLTVMNHVTRQVADMVTEHLTNAEYRTFQEYVQDPHGRGTP